MTTIVDLSDEPKFTIKAVASQTGIRPVTLRAWERRHEILTPYRSDNHYRLYSERDIAILRWLKFRVDEGMSIKNAVSELRSMSSNSVWPEALPTAPVPTPGPSQTPPEIYARKLSQALIRMDQNRAGDLLREIHARFDLLTVFSDILSPAIQQVSWAWYRGEIQPSTERFANAYLRGKLLSLLQAYPSRHNAPLIFVGCAPLETHELHALMLAVLLRSHGYRVDYLGPDLNLEDLADYASYEQPAVVVLSADSEFTAREIRHMQQMLAGSHAHGHSHNAPVFGYMGPTFKLRPALCQEVSGVYLGDTFEQNLERIRTQLKQRQKTTSRLVA